MCQGGIFVILFGKYGGNLGYSLTCVELGTMAVQEAALPFFEARRTAYLGCVIRCEGP